MQSSLMSTAMDETQIARSMADIYNRLTHSDDDSESPDNGHVPNGRSRYSAKLRKLERMTEELAESRANATARTFWDVLRETQFEVTVQLAKILAETMDPVLEGLRKAVIEEEGHVCGVCQDEMEVGDEARAMACMHTFHAYCIVEWLKQSNACPLCRYRM